MKAQHPTRQTYQKSEIDKTHTAIKSQTQNPLQTNQSDCDKRFQSMSSDFNLIQAQIETLKRQDRNIKSTKNSNQATKITLIKTHIQKTLLLRLLLEDIEETMKTLTLFRMGIFGAAHEWGGGQRDPLPKICHTYPTIMKLGTVIPYLDKIQKIYESRNTPSEFC